MNELETLRGCARQLIARGPDLESAWTTALGAGVPPEWRPFCRRWLEVVALLGNGDDDGFRRGEDAACLETVRQPGGARFAVAALRMLERVAPPPTGSGRDAPIAGLAELIDHATAAVMRVQDEEFARRLAEAQDHSAAAVESARELQRANEALRKAQGQSQRRSDQLAVLASTIHRIAGVLDPDRLLQTGAEIVQGRLHHMYVAIVVLDNEGVLVGRWAGRPGLGRHSAGRAQGPAGGVIGRAIRTRSPQVVADVAKDADYHADVPGTRSEMVVPLLENGEAIGAIDFQSDREHAFDLDDVVAAETLAEFLVVALRNARLFAEARSSR